jgi:hypothetical protein
VPPDWESREVVLPEVLRLCCGSQPATPEVLAEPRADREMIALFLVGPRPALYSCRGWAGPEYQNWKCTLPLGAEFIVVGRYHDGEIHPVSFHRMSANTERNSRGPNKMEGQK